MKKTWYVAALAVIVLASCSKEMETAEPDKGKTPILLGTGVSTKAPVNTVTGLNDAGIGIFGITTTNTTAATSIADWTAAVILDNVKPASVKEDNGIVLPIPYYYPAQNTDYVKFMAFHPYAATGTSGDNYLEVSAASAPVFHFTLTGQEDLMCAVPAIGNNETTTPPNLEFAHKLTQITFKVIKHADMAGVSGTENLQITGIQFASANTTGSMNIEDGLVSGWATPGTLVAFNEAVHGGKVTIPASTAEAAKVGVPVMLQPGQAKFLLNVSTSSKTFTNVEVVPGDGDTEFKVGKSYDVTLTFNLASADPAEQIQLTASVQPWITGGTGSGSVTDKP